MYKCKKSSNFAAERRTEIMKRNLIIITLLMMCLPAMRAEEYTLVKGAIFYRVELNSGKEVRMPPEKVLPNENVYVRMHPDSKEGEVFIVKDAKGKSYICRAPKTWSAQSPKLRECLKMNVKQVAHNPATTIKMGGLDDFPEVTMQNSVRNFHYLYAFVSDFDDKESWLSFPYAETDIKAMQSAINTVKSQQQYRNGRNYILTNPNTTKRRITNCMDSIMQSVNEGDLVLLYLSSHGAKDEDGRFQLILKDSYRDANGQYTNALTKDEINHYVNRLTEKRARVLFFLDACYAGAILDSDIQGEAAYYLSTNGSNPAYYNHLLGSPFAIALMETMTGSLNGVDDHCFRDNAVQVGSLGNYLSNAVFAKENQQPVNDMHAFLPSHVLWRIHPSREAKTDKKSIIISNLRQQAANKRNSRDERAEAMLELGDRYYEGRGVEINFDSAYYWYSSVEKVNPKKEVRAKALLKLSECFEYGNPEQDSVYAYKYAYQAAELGNLQAVYKVGKFNMDGYGTAKNEQEGVVWVTRAAQGGQMEAQRYLGYCYHKGIGVQKNYPLAIEWLTKAAEQGDAKAQTYLASRYYRGEGTTKNIATAVRWWREAAEQGEAKAQYALGFCYHDGDGVPQSNEEAVKWFTLSAEQGYTDAQCILGIFTMEGIGRTVDMEEAAKWYKSAAEQGHADAQYLLGSCYYYGDGVAQSYEEAVQWWTAAAKQGDKSAQYELGMCYLDGEGVAKNIANAMKWLRKSAEQENEDAEYVLGACYYNGKDIPQNYAEAVKWWTRAAKKEHRTALYYLGLIYYDGRGVPVDHEKAVGYWRRAAEQGHVDAQYLLGTCYYGGDGVALDYKEAVKWCSKAAEQGIAGAQNLLGICYQNGFGVEVNENEAVKWWLKAAEQGDKSAQCFLGQCYMYGMGVTQNLTKGAEWWRKSAEQGNIDACVDLGTCYYLGRGVPKDYKESKKWWEKAAEQGNAEAQYNLGQLYYNGTGVKTNHLEAVKWWLMAAENGNAEAQYAIGVMYYLGDGVRKDPEQAKRWICLSKDQGNKDAIDFYNEVYIQSEFGDDILMEILKNVW